MKKAATASAAPPRVGRPRAEFAGEVEARILDAAAKAFLERGFDGASIEAIAEAARAGKPTIYARFPDKQSLFEAAVLRQMAARNARLQTLHPSGATVEERLNQIGVALVEETLTEETIGLLRLAIAEVRRRPGFAGDLTTLCRERGAETVAHLLIEGLGSDPRDANALKAGRLFAEMILVPFLLRALAEPDLQALRAEIAPRVKQRVGFFLAALRHGGLPD